MTDTPTDMIGPATFDAQDVTGPPKADAPDDMNGPATRIWSDEDWPHLSRPMVDIESGTDDIGDRSKHF
jgi:hypothetical protein